MRDRIRWQARGAPLDSAQLVTLAQHVEHWAESVRGYGLLVPREREPGLQLHGELLILERLTVRGALPETVARVLDAMSELTSLVPTLTVAVMTDDVVFADTPMGFERRARERDDDLLIRPENWVPIADVAPLSQPILTLAEEASRHALPIVEPDVELTPDGSHRFEDLDRDDDATAMRRAEGMFEVVALSRALLLVAKLRDRPRSEEQQRLFDLAMAALAAPSNVRVAPTLVLVLEGTRAEGASDRDWCYLAMRAVQADERTRDDVATVREALAEGSTNPVIALSSERRAQLLAYEADDLEFAKRAIAGAERWFARNRERLDELKRSQ